MKRLIGLFVALALVLSLAVLAFPQAKKAERVRYSGNITMVSKDASSFTLQKVNEKYTIFYDEKTVFTNRNKKGATAADLKDGRRVICLVDATNKEKLLAKRVDFRD